MTTMTKHTQVFYDSNQDFYKLLGVSTSASTDEIRRAFRQKAKEIHPDVNTSRKDWATEQFRKINDAQYVLIRPALRAVYDKQRIAYLNQIPADKLHTIRQQRKTQSPQLYIISFLVGFSLVTLCLLSAVVTRFSTNQEYSGKNQSVDNSYYPICDSSSKITQPHNGDVINSGFDIRGTASSANFAAYKILLGKNISPGQPTQSIVSWLPIGEPTQAQVINGSLSGLDPAEISLFNLEGAYTIRLIVSERSGVAHQCDVQITVVRSK